MNTKSEAVLEIKQLHASEWERLRQIRLAALKEAPGAFGSTFSATSTVDKEGWTNGCLLTSAEFRRYSALTKYD